MSNIGYRLRELEERIDAPALQYIPECATENDRAYFLAVAKVFESIHQAVKAIAEEVTVENERTKNVVDRSR